MRKLVFPLAGAAMAAAAVLLVARAEAAVSAAPSSTATIAGDWSAVEKAATCVRRRVCGPRGCVWRTVCRRWR